MPPPHACAQSGLPSCELTGVICRVPLTQFSQAPWYSLPVHLCRFRVRSYEEAISRDRQAALPKPTGKNDFRNPSHILWPLNINSVPIDYAFRPRLRDRLTLRRLALRRNPWTFGESVSHTLYRYSCQHSHFSYLHRLSRVRLHQLRERSATACIAASPKLRCMALAPLHFPRGNP